MTVLILCHGNIARSPLSEAVMRHQGVQDLVSAGFKGEKHNGTRSPKKVRDWAAKVGLNLDEHRSQTLTIEMLRAAEIILYMDTGNLARLTQFWDGGGMHAERGPFEAITRPLGAWLEPQRKRIADPNFVRPDQSEFDDILNQVVQASMAFSRYWLEKKAAA